MIVEFIIGSATVVVVASLAFARSLMKIDQIERQAAERKKFDLRIPTVKVISEVRTCPYCRWSNNKSDNVPTGSFVYSLRNSPDTIRGVKWSKDCGMGPSSSFAIVVKGHQRLWQMCTHCFAQWLCFPPDDDSQEDGEENV